ncbi:MAG TPA: hypothetical protein VMS12_06990 [Thermoanaerobaculia bacterium]|nr:hypothetical protein [Thermoanaerobaculia bacterium]
MRRHPWQTAGKALAGFLLGLAVWWGMSPSYATLLAKSAEPVLRISEKPPVTRLRADGRNIIVNRTDFPRTSARPGVPAHDLTFNLILLTTLFAANRGTFSNRNVGGFALALILLYITHVFGVLAAIKSIYVLQLGEWSRVHYSDALRNFWSGAAHFYRLVGLYAFAFAIWWLCSPDPDAQIAASPGRQPRGWKKGKRRGKGK